MKVEIINCWIGRYAGEQKTRLIPPLTAAHLAALCPPDVEVSIRHEQVREIDYEVEADLVALSFMTGYAPHAYEVARRFRARGTKVVLGGPHTTLLPREGLAYADAVVVGEAEGVWPELLRDFAQGNLQRVYQAAKMHDLRGLPVPRYDLIEPDFILNHYVQATRGCPFTCSFCCLKSFDTGFRTRPVDEVLRDITHYEGRNALQNKVVWFWDDNLIGNRAYAKELFRRMIPLKKWWLTQASVNIADDAELVRLAAQAGCAGVFIGIESFNADNLRNVRKYQNKIDKYKQAIATLHRHGIGVMAGLIVGFDDDTLESVRRIPDIVEELGIDVPFLNIMTPFAGTPVHDDYHRQGRIASTDWSLYNGMSVVYQPLSMTPQELSQGYLEVWRELVRVRRATRRLFTDVSSARRFVASLMINGHYSLLGLGNHQPVVHLAPELAEPQADAPLPVAAAAPAMEIAS